MDIFFKILWAVLIFVFGGCLGAYIALKYLEESTNDLAESYRQHINFYKKMNESKSKLIENRINLIALYEQAFQVIHSDLVDKKDCGVEGLDELIKFVDGILNAKEGSPKEENKNDDHTG